MKNAYLKTAYEYSSLSQKINKVSIQKMQETHRFPTFYNRPLHTRKQRDFQALGRFMKNQKV
ncbi:hypothetical protein [Ligilactobacillus ruminis]|uniref:hypothetical protein n=1 Tax=Ligilactobacillus ruminis TaxID=1623 RepID=UPI00062CC95F|nr:hypothetical protein [Ligilactobacillus ruminis]